MTATTQMTFWTGTYLSPSGTIQWRMVSVRTRPTKESTALTMQSPLENLLGSRPDTPMVTNRTQTTSQQEHGGWRTLPVLRGNGIGRCRETMTTTLPTVMTDSGGHGKDTTLTTVAPTRSTTTATDLGMGSMTRSSLRSMGRTSAW